MELHFDALRLLQELDALPATLRECPSLPAEDGFVHEPHSAGSSVSGASSHAASSAGGTAAAAAATTPAWAKTRRFVFLELIGSGGFAVVFRAYDLLRHEYVACKLHHVDKSWGDARKEAFIRHVEREIDITVGVNHPRIVETYAAFELDHSSFVSVMPYCNGASLAEMLRKHGALPERDAKSILVGVLHGLRHLHGLRERVIHFDLKPANILFHEGEVKLSDFGLSKVMGEQGAGGAPPTAMELTSYGSGTHGYLPPECYEGDASRIDTKVDVFSAGVVFYVMLFYPHKPFFRQANQAEIMQMQPHAIRAETQALAFPAKVSADAQALLRRCLNPNRDERPDVLALLDDPYLAPARAARASGAGTPS